MPKTVKYDSKVTNDDCKKYLSNLLSSHQPESFKRVNKYISKNGMIVREFRHPAFCNMFVVENFMGILSIERNKPELRSK